MPEIGETLREARMRRRIDMTEVESATKIRAKYLRALENEEWDLLPGPTFVKTFLRTYSEYLDLDARLMVEEYKQRFERPSSMDLAPFSTGLGGQRRRRRPRASLGPGVVVVVGVAVVLGALYLLGTWGNDENAAPEPRRSGTATPKPQGGGGNGGGGGAPAKRRKQRRPRNVTVRIVATGAVYVCLEDSRGRAVVDKETLQAGQRTRSFRGRRFRVTFGTANARMRVAGRTYPVAVSTDPVGYELRPGRKPRRLPAAQRPTCL
jgi:helix-turn-helix protein